MKNTLVFSNDGFSFNFIQNDFGKITQSWKVKTSLFPEINALIELAKSNSLPPEEVKFELGNGWFVYLKMKTGQLKMMVAKPKAGEFIATIHGDEAFFSEFSLFLSEGYKTKNLLQLSTIAPVHSLSNFDLIIEAI